MLDLDLNDVATFVRVVENAGFAKAARELGVPTSTVSRAIARLEQAVGVRLLHRTTRNLSVTSEGHAFQKRVAPLVASLRDATRSLGTGGKEPEGTLRVTAPNDIGSAFLFGRGGALRGSLSTLQVELLLTNRKLNLVSEGIDVACVPVASSRRRSWRARSGPCRSNCTLRRATRSAIGCPRASRILRDTTSLRSLLATGKSLGSSKGRAVRRASN